MRLKDYAELLDTTYAAAHKYFPPHIAHAVCTLADYAILTRIFYNDDKKTLNKIATLADKFNDAIREEIEKEGGIEPAVAFAAAISVLLDVLLSLYVQEEEEASNGYA